MPSEAACSMGWSQIWARLEGRSSLAKALWPSGHACQCPEEAYQDRRAR